MEFRDPELEAVEADLRARRPAPEREFVDGLEQRLLPERRAGRVRPLLVGLGTAGGLACSLLALSLLGVGPLAPGDSQTGEASQHCRYVKIERRVREPVVVSGRDGSSELRLRSRLVERRVKRCR